MTVLFPIIRENLLRDNGIDPSSIQLRPQTYSKSTGMLQGEPVVPVNKTVVDSGTYSINIEDHSYTTPSQDFFGHPLTPKTYTLQPDQIEIRDQNNIFARVTTDSQDTVNLDGSGWHEVPLEQSRNTATGQQFGPQQHLYVNNLTNSAVKVAGDGTVNLNTSPSLIPGDTTFDPPPNPPKTKFPLLVDKLAVSY
jgi:hypothetical protein